MAVWGRDKHSYWIHLAKQLHGIQPSGGVGGSVLFSAYVVVLLPGHSLWAQTAEADSCTRRCWKACCSPALCCLQLLRCSWVRSAPGSGTLLCVQKCCSCVMWRACYKCASLSQIVGTRGWLTLCPDISALSVPPAVSHTFLRVIPCSVV